jgi:hypothetical protein
LSVLLIASFPAYTPAQDNTERRIAGVESHLEGRIAVLENKIEKLRIGASIAIIFLYAVFCELWAQNTGRNAWLWFCLGLFFWLITVVVLLVRNAQDRTNGRLPRGR